MLGILVCPHPPIGPAGLLKRLTKIAGAGIAQTSRRSCDELPRRALTPRKLPLKGVSRTFLMRTVGERPIAEIPARRYNDP